MSLHESDDCQRENQSFSDVIMQACGCVMHPVASVAQANTLGVCECVFISHVCWLRNCFELEMNVFNVRKMSVDKEQAH